MAGGFGCKRSLSKAQKTTPKWASWEGGGLPISGNLQADVGVHRQMRCWGIWLCLEEGLSALWEPSRSETMTMSF